MSPAHFGFAPLLALLAVLALPVSGMAQTANGDTVPPVGRDLAGGMLGGDNDSPIEIDAPGGIEWQQDGQVFIATGGATARRGTTAIKAEMLRAFYRDSQAGGSEIWRLDAVENVSITAPGWAATGGRAVYDVTQAVIVLSEGDPVTLQSGEDLVTAKGQVEFWRQRSIAVARGDATARREGREIRADVLTAKFEQGPDGKDRIHLLEGFDNVVITTAAERVAASRAVYDVKKGLARLDGNVEITQGENTLSGCSADYDLNTSVSRMKSCTGPGQRVRGVLMPGAKSPIQPGTTGSE